MSYILVMFVKAYQIIISPVMPASCRFHPTCSDYSICALRQHGALKGGYLSVKRLLKCQPFYKGDYIDPVPNTDHKKDN